MKEVSTFTKLMAIFFTGLGVHLLIIGDITNGLLSMILGEAIGLPKLTKD